MAEKMTERLEINSKREYNNLVYIQYVEYLKKSEERTYGKNALFWISVPQMR